MIAGGLLFNLSYFDDALKLGGAALLGRVAASYTTPNKKYKAAGIAVGLSLAAAGLLFNWGIADDLMKIGGAALASYYTAPEQKE